VDSQEIVMRILLTVLFLVMMVISFWLQIRRAPLKDYLSPGLTALSSLIVLFGVRIQNVPWGIGVTMAGALLLLAASDFVFERSVTNEKLFPIALGFGMLSGFIIGITYNLNALDQGISPGILAAYFAIAVLVGIGVYRYLRVEPALRTAVLVYLVQVIILLAGGLASLTVGNPYFGLWGVFIFFSDTLVGLRAFPNPDRPIPWLTPPRILIAILTLYYTSQIAVMIWALWA
jgi:hypothetical protein